MSRTYLRQQLLNGRPDDNADALSTLNSTCLFPNNRIITNTSSPGNPYFSSSQQPLQNSQSSFSPHTSVKPTKNELAPLSGLAPYQQISNISMTVMPPGFIPNQNDTVISGSNSISSLPSEYQRLMNQSTGISNENFMMLASIANEDIIQDVMMSPQCTFGSNLQTCNNNISAILPNSNYTNYFSNPQQFDQNRFYLQNEAQIYNQYQFVPQDSCTNQGILKNLTRNQHNMFDIQQQQQQQNQFIGSYKDEPIDMTNDNSSEAILYSRKEVTFAGSLPNQHDVWDMTPRRFDHQMRHKFSGAPRLEASSAPSLSHVHMNTQLNNYFTQSQDTFQHQETQGNCDSGFFISSANKAYGAFSSQLNTPKSLKSFDFSANYDEDESRTASRKAFHNSVERRRRDYINECISVLHDIVPIPCSPTNNDLPSSFDELSYCSFNKTELNSPASSTANNPDSFFNFSNTRTSPVGFINLKRNKGTILKDTINYIKTCQKQMSDLKQINENLRDLLKKRSVTASESNS